MKNKVICKCGNTKWRYKESIIYASYPPISADIYECINCGETYEKRRKQQSIDDLRPVVELFEEE